MKKLILVAASTVALGIGAAGYAMPALDTLPGSSYPAGRTTGWMAGYGVPAAPAQVARIQQAPQERHARGTTFQEPSSVGDGAPV